MTRLNRSMWAAQPTPTPSGAPEAGSARRAPDDIEAWSALAALAACHDLALQVSHMATFELDTAVGELSWSRSATAVLGCEENEVAGVLEELLAPITQVPASLGADFELEQSIETTGGEQRWVLVSARSWSGHQSERTGIAGAPETLIDRDGLFGTILDVTERRTAELQLFDLIDRYRLLIELSPDGIAVHEGGVVRYCNSACARMRGETVESILGQQISSFLHPDDVQDTVLRILTLTDPGMVTEPAVTRFLQADGSERRLEVISVRTTWEGRPAYQVIMRDMAERERAEAVLRAQAELVGAVSDAIISTDADERIITWNPAAERIFGWHAGEAIGTRLHELGGMRTLTGSERVLDLLAGRRTWSGDVTTERKDGSHIPVHASVATMHEGERITGIVVVCSDQSARRAAEAARAHAEARFSTVVAALDEGIAVIGADGTLQSVNASAARLLRVPAPSLPRALYSGEGLEPRLDEDAPLHPDNWPVQTALRTGAAVTDRTVLVRRSDGSRIWLRLNVHPLPTSEGPHGDELASVVCSFTDVTEQRASAAALAYAANHDPLTGLPNRSAMQDELHAALVRRESGSTVAVLFCDLDRFKDVNDSLGHRVGDVVLCEVANRLRTIMRGGDRVGRLGGDEFIVICSGVDDSDAVVIARRMVDELSRPFLIRLESTTMSVTLGASVGAALTTSVDAGATTVGDLLQAADVAMYRAKARGRNRVELFDASLRDLAMHRLETQEDLRNALESGELEVHYQALWEPGADGDRPKAIGVEALSRWTHPTRGPQSPADFIALAEETGLISRLGAYVLERACRQTAAWRDQGLDLYVSVNLSARQLSDVDLVSMVSRTLAATGLPAEALWLELTESALADETIEAATVLDQLVALGVRISIDDFGTGYSSLGRLRHYPVAALKIDRSFVADMSPESATDGIGDGGAIVESTIALAHRLGLSVVAEGVETVAQLERLSELGCEVLQGFLLGKPVAAHDTPFAADTSAPLV